MRNLIMNPIKSIKRNTINPMLTPEKPNIPKPSPALKKSAVKARPSPVPRKTLRTNSFGQSTHFENLKHSSVNLIDGIEKLRRLVAFSKYRPCFETLKSAYSLEKTQIQTFVGLKTKYKVWEILQTNIHRKKSNNNEIEGILEEYREIVQPNVDIGTEHYKRRLLVKSFDGFMRFYCQSAEISQILEEFYSKKLMKKSFEMLYLTSSFDFAIESFVKVMFR